MTSTTPDDSVLTRVHRVLTGAAVAFLLLVLGATVGAISHQPLTAKFKGLMWNFHRDLEYRWWWRPARSDAAGVVRFDPDKAQDGVTLYVSTGTRVARLIDLAGNILHEWHDPDATEPGEPSTDPLLVWETARVLPNGDLLAIVMAPGRSSWLIKIDRDSKLIWRNELEHHHSIDVAPDGRIVTLTKRLREHKVPGVNHVDPPILEDFVTILDSDGKEIRSFSVIEAFIDTDYYLYAHLGHEFDNGDTYHTNEAEILPAGLADKVPFLKEGRLLVSLRETHTIAVIDPDSEKVVWATRGEWFYQHDPDALPNGNILLFDNRGDTAGAGRSRVIEIDPLDGRRVWSYGGTTDSPLDSFVRSGQQRLANGNTLIEESEGGRIVEVTPAGEIAWEFYNFDRRAFDIERVATLGLNVTRMPADALPFLREKRMAAR